MTEALVGDIGGTHARFALARREGGVLRLRETLAYPTAGAAFEDRLATYLEAIGARPALAAFGVAGPVEGGQVRLLNNDWRIDAAKIEAAHGFERVALFNDFAGLARGAPELAEGDLERLGGGETLPGGPAVVGGPGTGFGLAVLTAAPERCVVSGEGGHRAFSPQTAFEWSVRQALAEEFDYVSLEFVAAGRFQDRVYRAVCRVLGLEPAAANMREIPALAEAGDQASLALCRLRAAAAMTALGDAALLAGAALGGVFLAGGEAVRLKAYMAEPQALARFYERGPRTAYLGRTPLRLIVAGDAGLTGAAAMVL